MDWDLDLILANLPALVFRGYADGSIDLFDGKVEAMTGYPKDEFDSRRLRWTDLIFPEDRPAARTAIVAALRSTNQYTREYRILTRAGKPLWIHERSRIVRGADGGIERISGLFFDISEQKKVQEELADTEKELKILVENIPAVLFKGYLDGTVTMLDDKVEAMTGHRRESFGPGGIKWTDLILEEDRASARGSFIKALRTNRAYVREYRVRAADGHVVWIHERSQIICDASGRAVSVDGLFFDITERKGLEAAVAERAAELQHANERLAAWASDLEHRNAEINILGQMGGLLQSCNTTAEAYAGIAGFLSRLFVGDSGAVFTFAEVGRPAEAQLVWGPNPPEEKVFPVDECWGLRRGRAHGRSEVETGFRCRHAGEATAYVCVPMTAHGSALGLLHVVLESQDPERWDERQALTARVAEHLALALAKLRLQETLQHLSVRDGLTGLFNRRYLEETLVREFKRAERQNRSVGIIMADLDHFKRFNDTLGHDAGDALLRALGGLLQHHIRTSDIACRYGGEEFTVILQDVSPEAVHERAEKIRQAAQQMRVAHGEQVLEGITLSLGVAVFPANGATPERVLQAADLALYRAKQDGRNRVCVAEAL